MEPQSHPQPPIADTCSHCNGSGTQFVNIDADHRLQTDCDYCGGSGKQSSALLNAFTDQIDANKKSTQKLARSAMQRYGNSNLP